MCHSALFISTSTNPSIRASADAPNIGDGGGTDAREILLPSQPVYTPIDDATGSLVLYDKLRTRFDPGGLLVLEGPDP